MRSDLDSISPKGGPTKTAPQEKGKIIMNAHISHYQNRLSLPFTPSLFQANIWQWVDTGEGNAVVEAVAGSGKTEVIVQAARLMRGDGLFCAFNKEIQKELKIRLAGTAMQAKTVHAIGMGAIWYANRNGPKIEVVPTKYSNVVKQARRNYQASETLFAGRKVSESEIKAIGDEEFPYVQTLRLFELARLNLTDFESDKICKRLMGLALHHAIDIPAGLEDLITDLICHLAEFGQALINEIDFADMLWLPHVMNYRPRGYSWVCVDEAQDISRAALALVRLSVRRGGRMLFVGDRRQAIYGFAGADSASFERIIERTNATVLPLSVCYRCPTSVLEEARVYCEQIEARPNATEGVVRTIPHDHLLSDVVEGDMVLCRLTAPLVRTCFELIADGVAATVRGRNIGEGLCKILDKIAKTHTFDNLIDGLEVWESKQVAVLVRRGGDEDQTELRCDSIRDQSECLRIIFARLEGDQTFEAMKIALSALFSDETRQRVQLSTVHRAKGLQNRRVFILEPQRLRRPRAQRSWMMDQERNLAYVAFTRSQDELIFVTPKPKDK